MQIPLQIEDLLRRSWSNELLRFPLAAHGSVHIEAHDQSLPAQMWTDAAGASKVCFLTDLPALGRRTFRVRPGACGTPTDIQFEAAADRVRIQTSRFGLELPLGHFCGPSAPAPVTRLRGTDDTWFGGGRWFGEHPVELRSEMTAAGPVLAEICVSWTWADGATGSLRVELAAGDCQALWESWSGADRADRGWDLSLHGLGPLALHQLEGKKWKNTWGFERGARGDVTLDDKWVGMLTRLTPWPDWWDDQAQTAWRFTTPRSGFVLQAASRDAGDWVEPEPPGTFASWDKRMRKMLSLCHGEDGDVYLRIDQAGGWRKWLLGASGTPVGRELDRVRNLTLDWPDLRERPFLFVNAADLAARRRPVDDPEVQALLKRADEDLDAGYCYGAGPGNDHLQNAGDDIAISAWLLTGDPAVAETVHLVERLRRRLNWLGEFDLMRYVTKMAVFFDLVSHSDLVDPVERRVFRAQMAYLGYRLADPATWSMERGYRSGAPNMSISYTLNLGMVACAIPDHPEAARWASYATARYRQWLAEKSGPHGEWPESLHYTHVSTNEFLTYAIAARNAGFADLLAEGGIKRVMLYAAKLHAPPDPRGDPVSDPILDFSCRRAGVRGLSPLGRAGSTGGSFGHYGLLARATAQSDPAFSRIMQWMYRETGWNECYSNQSLDALRLVYPDRGLPAEVPDWKSEAFTTALVLRDRMGAADEDYLVFDAGALFTSPGEHAGLNLWFWKGRPLVSRFSGGYDERAEALISNLSRAVPRSAADPATWSDAGNARCPHFTSLTVCDFAVIEGERGPALEQLHGYPPGFPGLAAGDPEADETGILFWRRQILYVRDPAGAFLILRDRAAGQRGLWKLWTLSDAVTSAAGMPVAEHEAVTDHAFTAKGRFGVDLDLLIATPADARCRTLRYRREYRYDKKLLQGFVDDQRVLQVGVPAGQACFCALVPRAQGDARPELEALDGGRVIRLRRGNTVHHIVLAESAVETGAGNVRCLGQAGWVRSTDEAVRLTLPAAGTLAFGELAVTSAGPVEVEVAAGTVTIAVPYRKAATSIVDLRLAGEWELRVPSSSFIDPHLVRLSDGAWRVQIIPEVRQSVVLHRR